MGANKMTKKIIFPLVLLFIFLIAGCGKENVSQKEQASVGNTEVKSKELVKVRYAQLSKAVLNIYIPFAAENGVFEKHGIDLEAINFDNGGPEALAAVASGQADMGSFGTPTLTGISKQIPYKLVASPLDREITFVLVATKDIKDVKDLKGKVIATGGVGSGPHQALLKILEANNIKKDEVIIQAAGDVNEEAILKAGQADAVITSEPLVTKLELEGVAHELVKAADVYGKYQHRYVFATNDFIKNKPEAVRSVLKAQQEAIKYAQDNKEELIKYAVKHLELDESLVRNFYDKSIPGWSTDLSIDTEAAKNAFNILKDLEEIDREFDPSDVSKWYDDRFLPN